MNIKFKKNDIVKLGKFLGWDKKTKGNFYKIIKIYKNQLNHRAVDLGVIFENKKYKLSDMDWDSEHDPCINWNIEHLEIVTPIEIAQLRIKGII